MIQEANLLATLYPIAITGGDTATRDGWLLYMEDYLANKAAG